MQPNIDIARDRDKLPPLDLAKHTAAFIVETIQHAGLRLAVAKRASDAAAITEVFNELAAMDEDTVQAYRENVTPVLGAILAGQAGTKRNGVTLDDMRYATAHEAVSAMLLVFSEAASVAGDTTPTDAEVHAACEQVMKWGKAETVAGLQSAIRIEHANATRNESAATPPPSAEPTDKPAASPEVERAAMLYKQATEADQALRTDKQVYDHLGETLEPEHLPPSLDAFQASLKRARKAGLLEPKRAPRHQGRATGKSVIRADQIEKK